MGSKIAIVAWMKRSGIREGQRSEPPDYAFGSIQATLLEGKSELKEFPQAQRLMNRPALKTLFPARVKASKTLRDEAICRACVEHGYSMADIARKAEVHYSTVSRVIKGER